MEMHWDPGAPGRGRQRALDSSGDGERVPSARPVPYRVTGAEGSSEVEETALVWPQVGLEQQRNHVQQMVQPGRAGQRPSQGPQHDSLPATPS